MFPNGLIAQVKSSVKESNAEVRFCHHFDSRIAYCPLSIPSRKSLAPMVFSSTQPDLFQSNGSDPSGRIGRMSLFRSERSSSILVT